MEAYLKPSLRKDFAHYVIRLSILNAVKNFIPELSGTVVDLGSGNMPYKQLILQNKSVTKYISIDWAETEYYDQKPDITWDGTTIPLANDSVDCILLTEVLEHLQEPIIVLKEVLRVLKHGGKLMGTTPFIWPLHEVPNDHQRLTPYGLNYILIKAGFQNNVTSGAGGWQSSVAQFLSAYVSFGIRNKWAKKLAKAFLYFPVLAMASDKEVTDFSHTSMVNLIIFKATKG